MCVCVWAGGAHTCIPVPIRVSNTSLLITINLINESRSGGQHSLAGTVSIHIPYPTLNKVHPDQHHCFSPEGTYQKDLAQADTLPMPRRGSVNLSWLQYPQILRYNLGYKDSFLRHQHYGHPTGFGVPTSMVLWDLLQEKQEVTPEAQILPHPQPTLPPWQLAPTVLSQPGPMWT